MEFLIGVSSFMVLLLALLALQKWLRPKNLWICRECRINNIQCVGGRYCSECRERILDPGG
jgi:hypothetical protein